MGIIANPGHFDTGCLSSKSDARHQYSFFKLGHYPDTEQLTLFFGDQEPESLVVEQPERWLTVRDSEHPGYEVSDWGRVRSYRINRTNSTDPTKVRIGTNPKLIGVNQPSGHRTVSLSGLDSKNDRYVGIHALVLEAFVGPCPEGQECCHQDGDPSNNRLENLRWDFRRSNFLDRIRHGKMKCAKLKESNIPGIWERLALGETATDIAKDYGVSSSSITNIRTGFTWTHIARALPGWPLVDQDRNNREPIFIPEEYKEDRGEIWRPIPGWLAYRVSNLGRVQSNWNNSAEDNWKDVSIVNGSKNRPLVWVRDGNGVEKTLFVHKCVLLAFLGTPPSGMISCHNDGDPQNNNASNLRWDTYAANARDRVKHLKPKNNA